MELWTASCAGCPGDFSNSRLEWRLPKLWATSCRSVFDRSWPSTSLLAGWCGVHSICDVETLGGLAEDSICIFHSLGKARELAIRTFHLTLQSAPSSFFTELPLPYGGGMPPFGSIVGQTVLLFCFRFLFLLQFCLVYFCLFSVFARIFFFSYLKIMLWFVLFCLVLFVMSFVSSFIYKNTYA